MRTKALAAVVLFFSATMALAQGAPTTESRTEYLSRTTVDFGESDPLIGEIHKPEHVLVQGSKKARFKSLVRVRTDFRDPLVASAHAL